MQTLTVSLIVALLVYAHTFKSDYNEEDLGMASLGCGIILALVILSSILGG